MPHEPLLTPDRAFSSGGGSFDRLLAKDTIRLCGLELGAASKTLAREPDNYGQLERELRQRVGTTEGEKRWRHNTGLDTFCKSLTEMVLEEVCARALRVCDG